jgi:hypothetical protein
MFDNFTADDCDYWDEIHNELFPLLYRFNITPQSNFQDVPDAVIRASPFYTPDN